MFSPFFPVASSLVLARFNNVLLVSEIAIKHLPALIQTNGWPSHFHIVGWSPCYESNWIQFSWACSWIFVVSAGFKCCNMSTKGRKHSISVLTVCFYTVPQDCHISVGKHAMLFSREGMFSFGGLSVTLENDREYWCALGGEGRGGVFNF